MISLRDNFNPVKRGKKREGEKRGREGEKTDRERRKENIIKLCLLKNVKLLKFYHDYPMQN